MSGGVDSSVSALLLKQQGFKVIGLYMKNWEEMTPTGACSSAADAADAEAVCRQLDIPFYGVRFVEEYREQVFAAFLADLKKGLTPNPDVLCNREIKFKVFLDKALELGADFLATGHYARTDGSGRLLRGLDPSKDQSYFLHAVSHTAFARTLFPVGHLLKSEVRALARQHNLATAEKKDSTGICFIGKRDFAPFLSTYLGYQPGPFKTPEGKTVGTHQGVAYYTRGQRRGLGLGGEGEPWFVLDKDLKSNTVYVVRGDDHPGLYASELTAHSFTWVSGVAPTQTNLTAKIRYRQADQPCTLDLATGKVRFATPQRAITPGQSIVFYDGGRCLGGGLIP